MVESTGATGGASIILKGTGGAGTFNNYGVVLAEANTKVTSVSGAIDITGTGGAGTSSGNYGIIIQNGAAVVSTGQTNGATITLNGIGGNGTDSNYGVQLLDAGTKVTSVNGAIDITGGGAGTGLNNFGIFLRLGAVVESTGTTNGATVSLDASQQFHERLRSRIGKEKNPS